MSLQTENKLLPVSHPNKQHDNEFITGCEVMVEKASGLCISMVAKPANQGPFSQRVAINRTMDINRSSMAIRVELAINRNPFWNGAQVLFSSIQTDS